MMSGVGNVARSFVIFGKSKQIVQDSFATVKTSPIVALNNGKTNDNSSCQLHLSRNDERYDWRAKLKS